MYVPTTRELDVKTIFVVTVVAVFLLITIVFTAQAGYEYFANRDAETKWSAGSERTYAAYGVRTDNADLAKLKTSQKATLNGETEGTLAIDEAMQQIADRYRSAKPDATGTHAAPAHPVPHATH